MTDRATDIFDKNLKAVEAKNPALAERLRSVDASGVEVERTRSGDYTFRYRGRYFHSRYDPWKEAGMQAEEILARKPDWVILFGLCCGYLLKILVRKGVEKIIVYEPSMEILKGVLGAVDLTDELSMDGVFLCGDVKSVIYCVRENTDGMDDLLGYQTVPYRIVFPKELSEYTRRVQNAQLANKVGIVTEIRSRLIWVENYFHNLRSFLKYPPIDALRGRFKGIPMVIVGAGPSLQKNAHLLKRIKDKALIFAAITAYKPLLKFGVVPHFVIAAEKVDLPEYFTYSDDDLKIRLVLGEVSHPEMFGRNVKGKFVFFNPYISLSLEQAEFWGSSYLVAVGGSVTTSALDMGRMFGCNPIIFIGQDLAFSDGRTHVDGGVFVSQNVTIDRNKGVVNIEEEVYRPGNSEELSFQLQWLKGVDGRPVPSKFDWVTFHQWFEKYMAELGRNDPSLKVINATEGGAFIEGMEHITLEEAIERHIDSPEPIEDTIREAERNRPGVDLDSLLSSFEVMLDSTKEIRKFAADILKVAGKAKKKAERKGVSADLQSNISKIKALEDELFDRAGKVCFMWEALVAYTYELKRYLREERDESLEEQFSRDLDTLVTSYTKVEETAKRFVPILERAIATIEEERGLKGGADGQGQRRTAGHAANIS